MTGTEEMLAAREKGASVTQGRAALQPFGTSFVRLQNPPAAFQSRHESAIGARQPGPHRFEIEVQGSSPGRVPARRGHDHLHPHAGAESQRGRGIGTQLVQAALLAAQAQHRAVIPACSMFTQYMRKHPETHSMLAPAGAR